MATERDQDSAILVLSRGDKDARLITSLLGKVGLKALSASNTDEALELFSRMTNATRLLIVDEAISPTIPAFLECVRSLDPQVRILLLSGREEFEPNQSWLTQTHVRAFLKKPFRRAKFLGSVLQLMEEPLARTA